MGFLRKRWEILAFIMTCLALLALTPAVTRSRRRLVGKECPVCNGEGTVIKKPAWPETTYVATCDAAGCVNGWIGDRPSTHHDVTPSPSPDLCTNRDCPFVEKYSKCAVYASGLCKNIEGLNGEIRRLQEENRKLKQQACCQCPGLKRRNNSLVSTNQDLTTITQRLENKNRDLKQRCEKAERWEREHSCPNPESCRQCPNLQRRNRELSNRNTSLEKENSKWQNHQCKPYTCRECSNLTRQNQTLENKHTRLRTEFDSWKREHIDCGSFRMQHSDCEKFRRKHKNCGGSCRECPGLRKDKSFYKRELAKWDDHKCSEPARCKRCVFWEQKTTYVEKERDNLKRQWDNHKCSGTSSG